MGSIGISGGVTKMMKHAAVLFLALAGLCQAKEQYTKTNVQSWDFTPGGKVELRVRAGEVHIVPTEDTRISLSYTMHSNHARFLRQVEPTFHIVGSNAKLVLKAPRGGNVDVELRVPAHTDLFVRLLAGDVDVDRVEGNHNVETFAGDIQIRLLENQAYGVVDASTRAGDVSAPFGHTKGWIGNSMRYEGAGKYRLHAHTFAGDVNFQAPSTAQAESPNHL
jgi:DUF4097 and DUF4098 domain-containing protein YvlB